MWAVLIGRIEYWLFGVLRQEVRSKLRWVCRFVRDTHEVVVGGDNSDLRLMASAFTKSVRPII